VTIRRSPSPIRKNFTILPNATLNDRRLSWEARGMLAYLLSKPDHWKVVPKALVNETSAGKSVVYRILKELEEAGYITSEQKHADDGTFSEIERVVHEISCVSPDDTASQFSVSGLAGYGLAGYGKSGHIERTEVEKELTGERTEKNILPTSVEAGSAEKGVASENLPYKAEFEELWALYPRKAARKKAYTQLIATLRRGVSLDDLRVAVQNYADARRGQDAAYTLHAATFWGPSDRWEDFLPNGDGLKSAKPENKPKGFNAIQDFLNRGNQ